MCGSQAVDGKVVKIGGENFWFIRRPWNIRKHGVAARPPFVRQHRRAVWTGSRSSGRRELPLAAASTLSCAPGRVERGP